MLPQRPDTNPSKDLVASTLTCLAGALAVLVLLTLTLAAIGDFDLPFVLASLSLGLVIALAVLVFLPGRLPRGRFGHANSITLLRGLVICPLAAAIGSTDGAGAIAWTLAGLAFFVLLLDGLDGWTARRRGEASAFGARFDMETDALFILVLSALIYDFEKAGAWVLFPGLLRYLFLAGTLIWQVLDFPLPPSWRRKAIYVGHASLLILCLTPALDAALASWLALIGFTALISSFAVDISWLILRTRVGGGRL